MQKVTGRDFAYRRARPSARKFIAWPQRRASQTGARFERLLIVLLCTLWGVGILLWALVSVVGFGSGPGPSAAIQSVSGPMPSSMPTAQTAAVIAIRVMFGW